MFQKIGQNVKALLASNGTKDILSFRKKLDSFRKCFFPHTLRLGGLVFMKNNPG